MLTPRFTGYNVTIFGRGETPLQLQAVWDGNKLTAHDGQTEYTFVLAATAAASPRSKTQPPRANSAAACCRWREWKNKSAECVLSAESENKSWVALPGFLFFSLQHSVRVSAVFGG